MSTKLEPHHHAEHATLIAKNAARIFLTVAPDVKSLEKLRRAVVDGLAGNAGCFEVVVRPGVRRGTVEISIVGSEQCVCSEREDERPEVVAEHLARALAEAHLGRTAA